MESGTLFIEVWTGHKSNTTRAAAEVGMTSVRVTLPTEKQQRTTSHHTGFEVPALQLHEVNTWYLNLDTKEGKGALEAAMQEWAHQSRFKRIVLLTSPPCTMHGSRVRSQVRKWRRLAPSQRVLKLAAFRCNRVLARNNIYYARRLHRLLDANANDKRVVHVHEQPQKSRMARATYPADDLVNTEWPWAVGVDTVPVIACATDLFGHGGKKFGKKYVFEVKGAESLREMLQQLVCVCDMDDHQRCEGKWTAFSGYYTYKLGGIFACGACAK